MVSCTVVTMTISDWAFYTVSFFKQTKITVVILFRQTVREKLLTVTVQVTSPCTKTPLSALNQI